jgi:hypothetical protein
MLVFHFHIFTSLLTGLSTKKETKKGRQASLKNDKFELPSLNNHSMSKNSFYTGQPIFSQLVNFIPPSLVKGAARMHQSDYRCKKFTTHAHLITMLYASFQQCTSLREVITGLQATGPTLLHSGLLHTPRRSTLSDANERREAIVFEEIYHRLYKRHFNHSPDSRIKKGKNFRELYIIDSTTISLFSNIIRGAGSYKSNGRKKGGVKAHVLLHAGHEVGSFIRITEGKQHDLTFLKGLKVPAGSLLVFDKAYTNYTHFKNWNEQDIKWVTRQKTDAVSKRLKRLEVDEKSKQAGVLRDEMIRIGRPSNQRKIPLIEVRRVTYKEVGTKKKFQFITNDIKSRPEQIAAIYKKRWQIELVFKRIKQRYPLRYFLGDNENAIRIQIWMALICDLLIQMVQDQLTEKDIKWSYANLASMVRLHLMTYILLIDFLKNPEKALLNYCRPPTHLPSLFD